MIDEFILTPDFYTKDEWYEKYMELLEKYKKIKKELINKPDKQQIFIDKNGKEYKLILTERIDTGRKYQEVLEENQQLKKQKDDVVDWLNNNYCYVGEKMTLKPFSDLNDLLRMLGEIE